MNISSKLVAAVFIVSATATASLASGFECDSGPKSNWMSKDTILQSLTDQGYKIRKVEIEDGCYEVYAMKDGNKYEVFVNPKTGIIEKTKEK